MTRTNDEILQQLIKFIRGSHHVAIDFIEERHLLEGSIKHNKKLDTYEQALKELLEYVERLEGALEFYGDKNNWTKSGEDHVRRLWLEPDSYTPTAYNGWELAKQALAGKDE